MGRLLDMAADRHQLDQGWTFVGPTDRAMDVHLGLLAEAATAALHDVDLKRQLAAKTARLQSHLQARGADRNQL